MRTRSQKDKILQYMRETGPINHKIAENLFGCTRIAARIADLKHEGHAIVTQMEEYEDKEGQRVRYASYWLDEEVSEDK